MALGQTNIQGIVVEVARRGTSYDTIYQEVVEVLRDGNAIPYVQQLVVEVLREKSDPLATTSKGVVFVVCA